MKKFAIALCASLVLLLSACGVSTSEKERMQDNLIATLDEAFLSQNEFVAFAPSIELGDVENGGTMGMDCAYHATFSCSFDSGDSHVIMSGVVGFDKDGFVSRFDRGLAIAPISIVVNRVPVSTSNSIYNLPVFFYGHK